MPTRDYVVRKLSSGVAGTVGSALLVWMALRGLRFSVYFAVAVLVIATFWLVKSFAGFASIFRKE